MWYKNLEYDYADSRIRGTIVKHKGEPVYVSSVNRDGAKIRRFNAEQFAPEERVNLNKIDCSPFKLGYVNLYGRASYIVRVPKRNDWRQGLRPQNLQSLSGVGIQFIPESKLYHMLVNQYPSLGDCFDKIKYYSNVGINKPGAAWHRDWAVTLEVPNKYLLNYRGSVVGKFINNEPKLDDKFIHLREALVSAL